MWTFKYTVQVSIPSDVELSRSEEWDAIHEYLARVVPGKLTEVLATDSVVLVRNDEIE
jgi:hypothetical protein